MLCNVTLVAPTRYPGGLGVSEVPANPYEIAKRSAEVLSPMEQLRLVAELAVRLSAELGPQPRSLMELEGLGREVWQGVDVEQYLRQERSWWDG